MKNLLWVIQNNIFKEENYDQIADTLNRAGIAYQIIEIVPFSHELIPEIDHDGPIVIYGSTLLTRIAQQRGWTPGAHFNDNFQHQAWIDNWGTECLNYDAKMMQLDTAEFEDVCFVRPAHDLKAFSGQVIEGSRFKFWREETLQSHTQLKNDTPIIVAPLKEIVQETRFFAMNGKIVTGSIYRIGRKTIYKEDYGSQTEKYAQAMIDMWCPADAFVIDIALLADGTYRVIEINCINSSGFYKSDISKIVQGLSEFA